MYIYIYVCQYACVCFPKVWITSQKSRRSSGWGLPQSCLRRICFTGKICKILDACSKTCIHLHGLLSWCWLRSNEFLRGATSRTALLSQIPPSPCAVFLDGVQHVPASAEEYELSSLPGVLQEPAALAQETWVSLPHTLQEQQSLRQSSESGSMCSPLGCRSLVGDLSYQNQMIFTVPQT